MPKISRLHFPILIGKFSKLTWRLTPTTCKIFDTRADAEKWAREVEAEMDKGVFVSRTEAESTTLKEALDRYIEEYIPQLAHADKK